MEKQLKKAKRIDGFPVEILEHIRGGRVLFTARIVDPPIAKASGASCEEAYSALVRRLEEVKNAYRNSNVPMPRPPRSRGNRRILDTLRKLSNRAFPPSIF